MKLIKTKEDFIMKCKEVVEKERWWLIANKAWDNIPYVAGDCVASVTEWNNMIAWIKRVVVSKSANYTAVAMEVVLVDASGGSRTITLPATHLTGQVIDIKKTDSSANAVIVDGDGGDTIDGSATQSLGFQYESVCVISDGTNWHMI